MCRSPKIRGRYALRSIVYLSEEDSRKGVMRHSGTEYTIVMPSGTKVEVAYYYSYLLVAVIPLDVDRGRSDGMCGNYNGHPSDDSWKCQDFRIPAWQSYFAGPASCQNYSAPIPLLCDCIHPNSPMQQVVCNKTDPTERSQYVCGKAGQAGRRKRSAQKVSYDDDVMDDSDIFYTMEQTDPPPLPDWPTASGISETEARSQCQRVLMSSPVYSQCQSLLNVSDLVENCVMDVRIADSFEVTVNYPYVMESMCRLDKEASINITSTDPKVIEEQKSELNELAKQICPKHCSGNGYCREGACVCERGFTKTDCSLEANVTPSIFLLRNNGICDRRKKPCMGVKLYADDLDDSRTIYCRVTTEGGYGSSTPITAPAAVVSDTEIVCNLPESPVLPGGEPSSLPELSLITYKLSISNNGVDYSASVLMTVFDSYSCFNCVSGGNCSQGSGTCTEKGVCYSVDEIGRDPCKICKPSESSALVHDQDIKAPMLLGERLIEKQIGQMKVFQFETTRQDRLLVTFKFTEVMSGIKLLPNGSLVWNENANKNITVSLILENQCGLTSTWDIQFWVVVDSDWSPWTLWSDCSHDCDFGIQTRARKCSANEGCPDHNVDEMELCLISPCQAFPEEKSHGFVIEVLEMYLVQVLYKEKALFQSVAEIINRFCSKKAEMCCKYHGFQRASSSRQVTIASGEDSSFAAGYPLLEKGKAVLKIVTKGRRSSFDGHCATAAGTQRGDSFVYVDCRVLNDSAEEARIKIEQAIGVPVLGINGGGCTESIVDEPKNGFGVGAIAGIVVASCLIVAFISVAVWFKRFKKSPDKKYHVSRITKSQNSKENKPRKELAVSFCNHDSI